MRWEEAPATAYGLSLFVAHLSLSGLSAQTARVYLASVRQRHIEVGADTSIFQHPRVTAVVQGLRRNVRSPARRRAPISWTQMVHLKQAIHSARCLTEHDQKMLWAAVSLGYFGLLRASEYLSPKADSFDPGRTLIRRRLDVNSNRYSVFLPVSKADQFREGSTVVVGATHNDICPVAAMKAYVDSHRVQDSSLPLFIFGSGRYLTLADVNFWLRRLVADNITSHSLRIGGTTRAAEAGAETWQLQASGRWRSDAYQRYIRPSANAAAGLAPLMAGRR